MSDWRVLDRSHAGSQVPLSRELAGIENDWGRLAGADPLWAICVDPAARHGGWDPAAFYTNGAAEVARTLSRAADLGMQVTGQGLVQRRLLGYPAPMRMHGLPEHEVRALLAAHGAGVLAAAATRYHPDWCERRYYCVLRPGAAPAAGSR